MKVWISVLSLVLAGSMPSDANAARMESVNIIHFDANHNVIGQQAEFCNNVRYKGGATTGTYTLLVYGQCGDPIVTCEWYVGNAYCYYQSGNYGVSAELIGQFGSRTIAQACTDTAACNFHEPTLLWNRGFTLVQY